MFSFHYCLLLLWLLLCGVLIKNVRELQSKSLTLTRTHTLAHGIRHTQTHARTHTATSNSAVRKRQHESAYEKNVCVSFPENAISSGKCTALAFRLRRVGHLITLYGSVSIALFLVGVFNRNLVACFVLVQREQENTHIVIDGSAIDTATIAQLIGGRSAVRR